METKHTIPPEFQDTPTGQIKLEAPKEVFWGRYLPLAGQFCAFAYSVFAASMFVSPLIVLSVYCATVALFTLSKKYEDPVKLFKDNNFDAVVATAHPDNSTAVDEAKKEIPSLQQHPHFFEDIRLLSQRAGLKVPPSVLFYNGKENEGRAKAYSNKNPNKNVLAINTKGLETLERDEVNAVIGHEITHMKRDYGLKKDAAAGLGFVHLIPVFTSFIFSMASKDPGFLSGLPAYGINAAAMVTGMHSLFFIGMAGFAAVRLIDAIEKKHAELIADRGSALITGKPEALVQSWKKLIAIQDGLKPTQKLPEFSYLKQFPIVQKCLKKSFQAFARAEKCAGESLEYTLEWVIGSHPPLQYRINQLEKFEKKYYSATGTGAIAAPIQATFCLSRAGNCQLTRSFNTQYTTPSPSCIAADVHSCARNPSPD